MTTTIDTSDLQLQSLLSRVTAVENGILVLQNSSGQTGSPAPTLPGGTVSPPIASPVLQINCGSQAAIGAFVADKFYSGGNFWPPAGFVVPAVSVAGVLNVALAQIYASCRTSTQFAYLLAGLSAGKAYTTRLHFAELDPNRAGTRFTNVTANGVQVLTNFDPANAAGGVYKAVVKEFAATADLNGLINLNFTSPSSFPLVCAIEVIAA